MSGEVVGQWDRRPHYQSGDCLGACFGALLGCCIAANSAPSGGETCNISPTAQRIAAIFGSILLAGLGAFMLDILLQMDMTGFDKLDFEFQCMFYYLPIGISGLALVGGIGGLIGAIIGDFNTLPVGQTPPAG